MTDYSKGYGRIAGLLYMTIAVAGGFSIAYVPSVIDVAGDGAGTAANILANPWLYGLGQVGDMVVMLAEVILSIMLFLMFRGVSVTFAGIATASRLMMVAVMAAMLFFQAIALMAADGSGLSAFTREQLDTFVMLFTDAHHVGVKIWELFFALHLVILGVLVVKSPNTPSVLGWMMAIGSGGYLVDAVVGLTAPDFTGLNLVETALLTIVTIGEVSFALWLLIVGTKSK